MPADKQIELFPDAGAPAPKSGRVVTRTTIVLARRLARIVEARGPQPVTDLAATLGADLPEVWLAAGVAQQWRRVCLCDGYAAPAPERKGPAS